MNFSFIQFYFISYTKPVKILIVEIMTLRKCVLRTVSNKYSFGFS
ncbi:protein of unknown function [Brochothrix thermosphacta]|nr:protein of unknown function [Brochothrix thermosphacta]